MRMRKRASEFLGGESMCGVRRVIAVFLSLVVMLVISVFVLENQQEVSLSFFGLSTAQLPVSVFVVMALILGMFVGPLLGVLARVRRPRSTVAGHG